MSFGSLKILISAAETSSDAHGAQLLKALRRELEPAGIRLEAFGVGGPKLQAEGLRSVVDARELLAMGFVEVLGRLPRALTALRELEREAAREKPALAVVLDYPDFHFRLAKRLKALGIPAVYYIPPKVWVWRKGRIKLLRELFVRVLSILPFEEKFYRSEQVPVRYVGNPLVDELPLELTRVEARGKLGIGASEKVLVLMPGSRPSELRRHLELLLDSAQRAAAMLRARGFLGARESLKVLLPLPVTADEAELKARVETWLSRSRGGSEFILDVRVSRGNAAECLVAADAGLIKSGTSTLEAGLLGCPHAIIYKPSALTSWIFKNLIRYSGPIGLTNLVAEQKDLVREITCGDATPVRLAEEVVSLFMDSERITRMSAGFRSLREKVAGSSESGLGSPSMRAAREICSVLTELKRI